MKIKTLFVMFVLLAVALAACGTETVNDGADNSMQTNVENGNQNNSTSANAENGNQNQTEEQPEAAAPTKEPETAAETADVSFANDVLPILESRCLNCHGGDRVEGGFQVGSYASLMAGSEGGAVILPGDAIGSLLYELAASGEMPKRGANLTPVQLEVIEQWINAGALDN